MKDIREIERLNFEDMLWIIFIILSVANIVGNNYQKKYVSSNIQDYEDCANNISVKVFVVLIFIYLYFFFRNYNMYNNKDNPSGEDLVKVIGSFLFILGALCLLYFQVNSNDNFIGSAGI